MKYRLEYDVYRYGDKANEILLDLFNSYVELTATVGAAADDALIKQKNALKKKIENYIDNEIDDDANFIIETGA
jgi:hypothetical protein